MEFMGSGIKKEEQAEYQDQSAHNLILSFAEDDIDLAQFRILTEGWVDNDNLIVQAGIIGASHFVKINSDKGVIYEVFSCIEVESNQSVLYCEPLDSILKEATITIKNEQVQCSFQIKSERWESGKQQLKQMEEEGVNTKTNQLYLAHNFTGINPDYQPKTLVNLRLEPEELFLKTVHAYPNEERIIFTQSHFIFSL
jgi:hypothetical protein